MRILICHGYFLKGTGSNQYVQSFARSLCRFGHDVIIMCQDPEPDLDFVDSFIRFCPGKDDIEVVWERRTDYKGHCTVCKPDIGSMLPVYVVDSYPGFDEVRAFPDLSVRELEAYIEVNREALGKVMEKYNPHVIHVNHVVMLPYIVHPIAVDSGLQYFITVHGSAIEFTVRRDERFLNYGEEGLSGAAGIVVPSNYTGDVVKEIFGRRVKGLEEKLFVIPHGVDTAVFRPSSESTGDSVEKLLDMVHERTGEEVKDRVSGETAPVQDRDKSEGISREVEIINRSRPDWLPEPDLDGRLRELGLSRDPFIMYVGKLLETKGVQCALPAMPLILNRYPRTRLVLVGFGELRGILELMLEALNRGDLDYLERLCVFGNKTYDRCPGAFTPVREFLGTLEREDAADEYRTFCIENDLRKSVIFTGYLTQKEHSNLLPHASALLVPSLAPEAFGLVATEGMACGVPPVAPGHSGLAISMALLGRQLGARAGMFFLDDPAEMVQDISTAVVEVLGESEEVLRKLGAGLSKAVEKQFSWDAMASRMVALFQGGSS